MTLELDLKHEKMYLKFDKEELQRNREHEEKTPARSREHEIKMEKLILGLRQQTLVKEITPLLPPTNMHSITTPIDITLWQLQIFQDLLQHLSQQHLFHPQFAMKCKTMKVWLLAKY